MTHLWARSGETNEDHDRSYYGFKEHGISKGHLGGALDQVLKVAADEVVVSRLSQITPIHLLIALSRLSEEQSPRGTEDHGAALRREFGSMGIEPRRFRRRLRALLPQGQDGSLATIIHRSEATKVVFRLGNAIAGASAQPEDPVHLLRAIFLFLADVTPSDKDHPVGLDIRPADNEIPYDL